MSSVHTLLSGQIMSEGVSKEACFGFHNSHIMYEIFLYASITNVFHIYYIIILNTYLAAK